MKSFEAPKRASTAEAFAAITPERARLFIAAEVKRRGLKEKVKGARAEVQESLKDLKKNKRDWKQDPTFNYNLRKEHLELEKRRLNKAAKVIERLSKGESPADMLVYDVHEQGEEFGETVSRTINNLLWGERPAHSVMKARHKEVAYANKKELSKEEEDKDQREKIYNKATHKKLKSGINEARVAAWRAKKYETSPVTKDALFDMLDHVEASLQIDPFPLPVEDIGINLTFPQAEDEEVEVEEEPTLLREKELVSATPRRKPHEPINLEFPEEVRQELGWEELSSDRVSAKDMLTHPRVAAEVLEPYLHRPVLSIEKAEKNLRTSWEAYLNQTIPDEIFDEAVYDFLRAEHGSRPFTDAEKTRLYKRLKEALMNFSYQRFEVMEYNDVTPKQKERREREIQRLSQPPKKGAYWRAFWLGVGLLSAEAAVIYKAAQEPEDPGRVTQSEGPSVHEVGDERVNAAPAPVEEEVTRRGLEPQSAPGMGGGPPEPTPP
jgi:hypothetical protein